MSRILCDLTKIKAVAFDVDGVLSTATINMGDDGVPRRSVNTKDGYAIQLAVKRGLKLAIITGAVSPGVEQRYNNLGITDIFSGVKVKIHVFNQWLDMHGLSPEEVAYVGDDMPDMECIAKAGLGVCPADAALDVLPVADYISPIVGGHGVARDLLEQILKAQGVWALPGEPFGW